MMMMFYSHANKTPFHGKGFALSFVLKARVFLELGNNLLEKTQKKAIKAPVIVIGQLTANRCTTTIED